MALKVDIEILIERVRGKSERTAAHRDIEILFRRNARYIQAESVEERPDAGMRRRLRLLVV